MPIYRPKIQIPRRKPVEQESSVFDVVMGFNQIPEIAKALETLRRKYTESIERMDDISEETKKEVKDNIAAEIKKINTQFVGDALRIIESSTDTILGNLKIDLANAVKDLKNKTNEAESVFAHIKTIQKGDKPIPGVDFPLPKDGYTPKKGMDYFDGFSGKDAKIDEEKIINQIVKSLLDKKLKMENIFGLTETIRHLSSKTMLGGKMGGGQGSWKQKQLSGTINGTNKVFTFAGDPPAEFSERVFLNYIEQNPFTDYTISGTTVTYTTAPDASLSGFPHIIRFM